MREANNVFVKRDYHIRGQALFLEGFEENGVRRTSLVYKGLHDSVVSYFNCDHQGIVLVRIDSLEIPNREGDKRHGPYLFDKIDRVQIAYMAFSGEIRRSSTGEPVDYDVNYPFGWFDHASLPANPSIGDS